MNFEWKQTTEQDLEQFNNWGKKDLKIQRFVDGKNLGNKILEMVENIGYDSGVFRVRSVYDNDVLGGVCVVIINKATKKSRNTLTLYNIVVNPELQNKGTPVISPAIAISVSACFSPTTLRIVLAITKAAPDF